MCRRDDDDEIVGRIAANVVGGLMAHAARHGLIHGSSALKKFICKKKPTLKMGWPCVWLSQSYRLKCFEQRGAHQKLGYCQQWPISRFFVAVCGVVSNYVSAFLLCI